MELQINIPELARLISEDLQHQLVFSPWMTTAQAAEYMQVPAKTLEQHRRKGTGPRFSRIGKHVRYSRREIDKWMEERQ